MQLTRQEILKLSVSVMYIGLLVDLGGAALFYLVGQFLRSQGIITLVPAESLDMLGYGLLAVSAAEIATIVVLKRRWISARSPQLRSIRKREVFYRQLKLMFATLFLVTLTPALYGFLYFVLGGTETLFILLIVATMIGYMLIRVRPNDLQKSIGSIELEDPE
ncbi:MAG: hypothetical protein KKG33_03055 [candidate division Zixibacteria bacterium]|nr:hypothetical protein [candidate division Zixibacteria bacterium]MBU1470719.1 hypothetical protein [candidate division Zixibacteria bacterium]MBU2624521.1 hypothetical protein [candidate division Zixibacteria bacterium]